MKNLFSKVLVGVAGFAMAVGMSAFAATTPAITDLKVEVKDKTAGTVTVSGTVAGDADSKEATIIVLPESVKTLADNFSNEDIKYIDQETAQTGGAFSFDFKLVSGVKYNVWCGGTEVAAAALGNDVIDLTSEASGYKIVGTIVLPAGKFDDVTAVAKAGTTETPGAVEKDGDTAGAYAITVADGTYSVVVGKPGYLYKTYSDVVVAGADKELGEIKLLAGQLNDDTVVDAEDLVLLLSAYKDTSKYSVAADLNDDTVIDAEDLVLLLSSYKEKYE